MCSCDARRTLGYLCSGCLSLNIFFLPEFFFFVVRSEEFRCAISESLRFSSFFFLVLLSVFRVIDIVGGDVVFVDVSSVCERARASTRLNFLVCIFRRLHHFPGDAK